jgi:YidC/Oxa1 family membrane protein insertase
MHCLLLSVQVLLSVTLVQAFIAKAPLRALSKPQSSSLRASPTDLLNDALQSHIQTFLLAEEAVAEVSTYSKIDKTGAIGFLASGVETVIDVFHSLLNNIGLQNSYGVSIVFFTIIVRVLTLPLTRVQLESTNKMQKLTPLQKIIQEKYATDEQTKNQLLSQLFQAANVNPLAGCFPALAQIPVFLSLYRALQNLIAEDKLGEPFLWIPNLEGPVYMNPPSKSLDWIKSAFSGTPDLGWDATLSYLSIPLILYISQSVSLKILQPPKDPNRVYTEQEQFSQNLLNQLPFVLAFFSLNVPAGLGLYWIASNVLTTVITLAVRQTFKDDRKS